MAVVDGTIDKPSQERPFLALDRFDTIVMFGVLAALVVAERTSVLESLAPDWTVLALGGVMLIAVVRHGMRRAALLQDVTALAASTQDKLAVLKRASGKGVARDTDG